RQGSLPGDVETLLALLLDAAPVDVLDQIGREWHAVEKGTHDVRRQIVGAHVAVESLFRMGPGDRRADCFDDDGLSHVGSPNGRSSSPSPLYAGERGWGGVHLFAG